MQRRKLLFAAAGAASASAAGCVGLLDDEPSDDDADPDETDPNESNPDDSNPNESDPGESDPGASLPELDNPSFESDLEGWTVGTDLPEKPGESTEKIDHDARTVTRKSSDGDAAVEFMLEGSADDGTVWVAQTVDLSAAESVLVDVYNEQKSFNILSQVAFYAGRTASDELVEADFDRSNDVEAHSGWKTFSYDVGDIDGEATVAVGMNIVWETEVRHVYDNVRLEGDAE